MENNIKKFIFNNIVPIIIFIILAFLIPVSKFSMEYIIKEIIIRISRNLFLVLSLIIPIIAGMGLNFGIVLGAMGGQLALIAITEWKITGLTGFFLAVLISIPISALLGYVGGKVLNKAKGKEMITSMILGFFMNGVYQLVVLYAMGPIIPISNKRILLSSGRGIRNTLDISKLRKILDNTFALKIGNYQIPILTFFIIFLFCLFIIWIKKTKLGHDMKAIGQNMEVARSSGINVDRTRLIAIIISTVLAGIGQLIFLQNIGTVNTYNSHEQIGMFSIAALLVGGASISKASISNAITGIILFHTMFIVAPKAGKELMGAAEIGEYFRVFVSYGIIAMVLIIYEWKTKKQESDKRLKLMQEQIK